MDLTLLTLSITVFEFEFLSVSVPVLSVCLSVCLSVSVSLCLSLYVSPLFLVFCLLFVLLHVKDDCGRWEWILRKPDMAARKGKRSIVFSKECNSKLDDAIPGNRRES